jgi:uncharacterized protein DUF1045
MGDWHRYAVFAVPQGRFYDTGAAWLGWDSAAGLVRAHPGISGLPVPVADLTARPRKYGFHGTLMPPFRLAAGEDLAALKAALSGLTAAAAPVNLSDLRLTSLGRFLALVPSRPDPALNTLAAHVVTELEPMRAGLTAPELAKRRAPHLTTRQMALLVQYGTPHVLDQFRFHLTLTGPLPDAARAVVTRSLRAHFAPFLTQRHRIADLALMGQDAEGWFHLLQQFRLGAG